MAAISIKANYLLTGDITHFGKYFGKRVNGQACADAVKFVPASAPIEIILDNAAAGASGGGRTFTGTWCTSISAGYYGTDSLYSCGSATDI